MKRISMLILLTFLLIGCSKAPIVNEEPNPTPPVEEPEVEVFRSVFSGEVIEEGAMYKPLSVIIENSAAARPHSGLSEADIVYEFTVDGFQITRFLAIFNSSVPNKIGPVRSGRIPFVEIAKQWMLPFVHYGAAETGQGDAYSIIRNTRWPIRFDGVSGLNHSYFYRDTTRRAPHNAYFRGYDALAKVEEMDVKEHFAFDEASNIEGDVVSKVSFRYSGQLINSYEYDRTSGKYDRFINGSPMLDLNTGNQITVKNVLVIHAPHRSAEVHNYALIDFRGEGNAEFFIEGKHEVGIWKNENNLIRFYKTSGEEIVLLPGNTWIQVVHEDVKITLGE